MINASLKELAAALAAKQVSSLELTDLYLGRIAQHNPLINAFVTVDEEKSRTAAKAADIPAELLSVKRLLNEYLNWCWRVTTSEREQLPLPEFLRPWQAMPARSLACPSRTKTSSVRTAGAPPAAPACWKTLSHHTTPP